MAIANMPYYNYNSLNVYKLSDIYPLILTGDSWPIAANFIGNLGGGSPTANFATVLAERSAEFA